MRSRIPLVLACALLLSCASDDGGVTPPPDTIATVEVLPASGIVVPGGSLELQAVLRDARGNRVSGREVIWGIPRDGTLAFDEARALVIGLAVGGPVAVQAHAEGRSGTATVTVVTTGSELLDRVLAQIGPIVKGMRETQIAGLSLNPQHQAAYQQKIEMLRRPELSSEIVLGRYLQSEVASFGRTLPLVGVYPVDTLKAGTGSVLEELQRTVPVLESYIGAPVPAPEIRLWYGFGLGSSGGGGMLNLEDRGTFHARSGPVPYESVIAHELSHSYIGHEWLTQVLELYVYNVARTGSTQVEDWTFTRDYVPDRATNTGVHAALDVYRLLGPAVMADAFRALHALYPPYGQPLSEAARQAIIDRAPTDVRELVAQKVAAIDD